MALSRQTNGTPQNHIAAIHVLKSKLRLSDDDYRALIKGLTFKSSSKDMSQAERQRVRDHMQVLADRAGLPGSQRTSGGAPADWRVKRDAATPSERKVWALWNSLRRAGKIDNNSEQALNAWIKRTVHVETLRFCTGAQLDTLIEGLKVWNDRG